MIVRETKGIGLAALKQLLKFPDMRVIVASRRASSHHELGVLQSENVELFGLDIANQSSLACAAKHIASNHGAIDILVANAVVEAGGGGSLSAQIVSSSLATSYF